VTGLFILSGIVMGFTKVLNPANIAKPQLSISWIIGGVVAAAMIVVVYLVAVKGVGFVQSKIPASTAVMAPVRTYMS
jgi:hypothetical protein